MNTTIFFHHEITTPSTAQTKPPQYSSKTRLVNTKASTTDFPSQNSQFQLPSTLTMHVSVFTGISFLVKRSPYSAQIPCHTTRNYASSLFLISGSTIYPTITPCATRHKFQRQQGKTLPKPLPTDEIKLRKPLRNFYTQLRSPNSPPEIPARI